MLQNFLTYLKIMLLILKVLKGHKDKHQLLKSQGCGTKGTGGPKELRVLGLKVPHRGTKGHGVCQRSAHCGLCNKCT